MPDRPDLTGRTVGITADRRGQDQAVMFRRLGAEAVVGPTISTVTLPDPDGLRRQTEQIVGDPPDYLIANTGIGIRTWVAQAKEWGLLDAMKAALAETLVGARGPKAAGALSSAGIDMWWRSPTEQLGDLIDHIVATGVSGRRVAFQLHGDDGRDFVARLEAEGAEVLPIPVYRWAPPSESAGAVRLIEMAARDELDAVTFTAGPQIRGLFDLADREGLSAAVLDSLNGATVVGCIGPVCAAVAIEEGIRHPLVPDKWRLGSLVTSVAAALAAGAAKAG